VSCALRLRFGAVIAQASWTKHLADLATARPFAQGFEGKGGFEDVFFRMPAKLMSGWA
jgi:hypothetical protein